MNKKFLSAILFGALMVTSTGTFVSCKDYDDDIDEINATLNDLKSQLAALQSKVDAGNYVTGVSKTADGIVFTFSNGSTSSVAIKDGEKGEAGKDGSIVTVVDGVLYIDGEATDIKAPADAPVTEFQPAVKVDSDGKWAVLQADGTYETTGIPASPVTVKGDDATGFELTVYNADGTTQVVKLPTANSVLDSAAPSIGGTEKFVAANGSPITWGVVSTKNDDWAGPLGKIAKDQLLIGQSEAATITVKPVTYDLSAQTLKLVDNQGNVAPVVVTATPSDEEWITESAVSRAVSKTGKWNLHIQMASSVTKDNIASAFKAKVDNAYKNKMYALTINGKAVTDYTYVIDVAGTGTTTGVTYNQANVKINGKDLVANASYELGKTHTVSYKDVNVADAYLSLSEAEKVKAEVMGVEVKGMTVTAPKTAANGTLKVTLNLLGTNGVAINEEFTMKFGTSTVDTETTLPATTYTLNVVNKEIDINLGNVFSGLSAAEFNKLSTTFSLAEVDNQKNFLLSSVGGVTYHKAKNDGSIGDVVSVSDAVDAKVIKYLRLPVANNVATDAKAGNYTLKLTLKDTEGNEMKKVTIPVTIALPSFGDLYAKSASGNWNGNTFTAKLMKDKKVNLSNAFNAKDNNSFGKITVAVAKVDDKQMVEGGAAALNTDGELTLTGDIINKKALRTSTLAAEASYTFYDVKDLTVSTTFTIDLHSQFEAPKLVYYVNNEAKNVATVGANNEIATLDINDKGVKNGLAILYGRGEEAFETGKTIDGVTLDNSASDDNKVVVKASIKDVANATATMAENKVTVSENKGTLVATFTDVNGIVTTATIAFE